MGNLFGVTITPVSKLKESKSVCLISDDEDDDSDPEIEEILEDNTLNKTSGVTCNEEINNKSNEIHDNKDCEIVSVTSAPDIIDITNSEHTETQTVNGNKEIEVIPDDKIDDIDDFAKKSNDTVSVKITEQIIDITENNEDNDEGSFMEVNEELNDTNFNIETKLDNESTSTSAAAQQSEEKTDDLLIAKSETSITSVDVLDESSKLSSTILIENFLELCKNMLMNTEYDLNKQFELLKQYYKKSEKELIKCEDFKKFIENNIKKAKSTPHQTVISFGEVFKHVKDLAEINAIEVTKKQKLKLKKLEFAIKLLVGKIKDLENAEIDFDDEEDSSYLQLERYFFKYNLILHIPSLLDFMED